MNKVTELRDQLANALASEEHPAMVQLAPTPYGTSFGRTDEYNFTARILVGKPDDEQAELAIDELFERVPELVGAIDTDVDFYVKSCSGHRLYASAPGEPPTLGAEWSITANV